MRYTMFDQRKPVVRKYAEFVIGEYSFFRLMKYELITSLFGPIPGVLGRRCAEEPSSRRRLAFEGLPDLHGR